MRPHSVGILPRLALAAALAAVLLVLPGCGPVKGDPLGSIFADLSASVNSVIEKAGAQAQFTTLAAAGAAQDAIGQAESAYATQLDKTVGKLDQTTAQNVARLQSLVADLQSGGREAIVSAGMEAQQLVNTIPFTNKNPQVTSYSPRFVIPSNGGVVQLRIRGNFVYAYQQKQTPTLVVDGTTYQPNLLTTQELGFAVPATAFPPSAAAPAPLSLELDTPYEHGKVFKTIRPGVFRLLLTSLPGSPVVSATLTKQVTTTGTATAARRAPAVGGWTLNSYDCNEHQKTQSIAANPGWTIVPSTVQYTYDFNKNPGSADVQVAASRSNIVVTYSTRPACFIGICNGCGSIVVHIDYQEEQAVTATSTESAPLRLRWGDVVVEPVPQGQWKVSLGLFDGTTREFSGSDHSNKYVLVDDQSSNVRIQVRAPEELTD